MSEDGKTRDPKAARDRVAAELCEARDAVDRGVADLRRLLEGNHAWTHERVRTARQRLARALGDLAALELLVPRTPAPGLDAPIPALLKR